MKPTRPLWRFSVSTTLEAEDAVSELLGACFNQPVAAHFNIETQISVVSVYGDKKDIQSSRRRTEVSSGLKEIKRCGLKLGGGKITVRKVRREDWAESWKRHFKAIEVGHALLIKPSWIKRAPRKNQAVVILDPGLSFGTGQHATTSFCLREIVRCRIAGTKQSFLDIGTGSGILAIAAAKLGYQPVHAFDFDPEAVRVALANARLNRVSRQLNLFSGDVTKQSLHPARQFDLVCANLMANLLIAERKRIVAQMNRHATLVLAGILKAEFHLVQTAFAELGLKLVASQAQKEWRSGSFRLV